MFKKFSKEDIFTNQSSISEDIYIGTHFLTSAWRHDTRIKTYSHWQSSSIVLNTTVSVSGPYYHTVYSRNFADKISTPIVDFTFGNSVSSSRAGVGSNHKERKFVYNLFAQNLLGSKDKRFYIRGEERNDLIFFCIKRNQYKDEIVPQTTIIGILTGGFWPNPSGGIFLRDETSQVFDGHSGRYGYLLSKKDQQECGMVFYDKGIYVIDVGLTYATSSGEWWMVSGSQLKNFEDLCQGSTTTIYDDFMCSVRQRFDRISFSNNSKIRNTFFICTAENSEYNYSSNPSFLDSVSSRIITTSGSSDEKPKTYITKVALTGENNEVLAIASLSRPVRKTPDTKVQIIVRLDF
jgi:hypothetical protein